MLVHFGKNDKKSILTIHNAMVGISIGQKYHESAIFVDLTQLVAKTQFNKRYLMLADSLQAYNLLLKGECDNLLEARQKARELGNQYLKNEQIKTCLETYNSIFRWDQFLNHPDYPNMRNRIDELYENDKFFKKHVDHVSGQFLALHASQLQNTTASFSATKLVEYLELCEKYVKEELAVMLLWNSNREEFPFNWVIYPKPKHAAAKYVHEKLISQTPSTSVFLKDLTYCYENTKKEKNLKEKEKEITKKEAPVTPLVYSQKSPVFTPPSSVSPSPRSLLSGDTDDEADASLGSLNTLQTELLELKKKYKNAKKTHGKESTEAYEARKSLKVMILLVKKVSIFNRSDSTSSDDNSDRSENSSTSSLSSEDLAGSPPTLDTHNHH